MIRERINIEDGLYVTTSWDDGDILDLRIVDMLDRYGVKGTFYITQKYRNTRLSEDDIRMISNRHEIGAHTLTHPDLRSITKKQKEDEIVGGKKWLEDIIGRDVEMFCYTSGFYDNETIDVVRSSGFIGSRTTENGRIHQNDNHFLFPTTLQVYPFPFRKKSTEKYHWRHLFQPFIDRSSNLHELGLSYMDMNSWKSVACKSFDIALSKGEIFHLWGHSWEIEKYGMWDELEYFLKYCKSKTDWMAATNAETIKNLK